MHSMIPYYKCFRGTFNSVQYTLHWPVCDLQPSIRELGTNPTARPYTIKYVQSRFISNGVWLIDNIAFIVKQLFAPWKFLSQPFRLQQLTRSVSTIESCTLMGAVLPVMRSTSYKRIRAMSGFCFFLSVRVIRAAFACLSYNTLPVSITQNVMYVRLQKDAVESFHSIIIIIISSVP